MTWEEKFWAKIDRSDPDGCWLWIGGISGGGYGLFAGGDKPRYAHRIAYELAHGVTLTSKEFVCHICDTPRCCQPKHLFKGDAKTNVEDALIKARRNNGPPVKRRRILDPLKHSQCIQVNLPVDLVEEIDQMARERGFYRTTFVRRLIERGLRAYRKK